MKAEACGKIVTKLSNSDHKIWQNFWVTVCKTVRALLSIRCLSCPSVCLSVMLLYCCQTVGWITVKPGMEVGLGPGHVLDVDPAPPPQRGTAPNLQPVFCGQTVGWIKMPLGTKVGIGPGDVVLDGDPAAPQFLAHVYFS